VRSENHKSEVYTDIALKHMPIIHFHDDEVLQCHMSVTVIELIKLNRCFSFCQSIQGTSWNLTGIFWAHLRLIL